MLQLEPSASNPMTLTYCMHAIKHAPTNHPLVLGGFLGPRGPWFKVANKIVSISLTAIVISHIHQQATVKVSLLTQPPSSLALLASKVSKNNCFYCTLIMHAQFTRGLRAFPFAGFSPGIVPSAVEDRQEHPPQSPHQRFRSFSPLGSSRSLLAGFRRPGIAL